MLDTTCTICKLGEFFLRSDSDEYISKQMTKRGSKISLDTIRTSSKLGVSDCVFMIYLITCLNL